MAEPRTRPVYAPPQASLLLRLIAIAASVAMLIAGILCLSAVTTDRVATGIIAGAVALLCLIVV